jgi:hypothetical protein
MSKWTNIKRILLNNKKPLKEVSKKAKDFLNPQVKHIKEKYDYNFSIDHKYSVIDLASMGYAIAIAEELSEYRMSRNEWIPCLLDIFGNEYEELFDFLFNLIGKNESAFWPIINDARNQAISDKKNGMLKCSNYLISHAEGLYTAGGDLEMIYKEFIDHRNSAF